jgi:hypothetical protein
MARLCARARRVATAVAVGSGLSLALGSGCSLALDTSGTQCQRNQDCARFSGAVCDTARRLCVPTQAVLTGAGGPSSTPAKPGGTAVGGPGSSSAATGEGAGGFGGPTATGASGGADGAPAAAGGTGRGCRVADGCTPCTPAPQLALLNTCSDVTCVAFDNHARLANLGPDGGLTPLP